MSLITGTCDCGGHTVARWNNLLTGVTRSCGCRKRAGRRLNRPAQTVLACLTLKEAA